MIVTRYVFSNVLATHINRPCGIEIHLVWLGFGIEKSFINTARSVLAKILTLLIRHVAFHNVFWLQLAPVSLVVRILYDVLILAT